MAWWAEQNRRNWYCICGIDMIQWYSDKLYIEWWNSLTDEQRERIKARRKAKQERDRRNAMKALYMMGATMATIYDKHPESYYAYQLAMKPIL